MYTLQLTPDGLSLSYQEFKLLRVKLVTKQPQGQTNLL